MPAVLTVFDLDAAPEPIFKYRFNGTLREVNVWTLSEKLEAIKSSTPDGAVIANQADSIREAFSLPKVGAVAENGETVKTPTTQQCLALMAAFFEFIQEIPEVKKLSALMQT